MTAPKSTLYTRTGDRGTTSLVGGTRIAKDDLRLEAYGTVDELNSYLGLLASMSDPNPVVADLDTEIAHLITEVQNKMFTIGAYLATPGLPETDDSVAGLTDTHIEHIERLIDRLDNIVPPLRAFVLPTGCTAATIAQVTRAVCRRAERRIIALASRDYVAPIVTRYINRLSDFLFVLARFNNISAQVDEIFWDKNC